MSLIKIDSFDDPRLDPFRDLKKTNATRWSDDFVAEGDKLTRRLLASRFPVRSIVAVPRLAEEIAALAPADTPVLVVPEAWVDRLVGFNFHRGVLARGSRLPTLSLSELAPPVNRPATIVVCPEIHDPENLGGLLRVASAFSVDAVLLGPLCADPLSRRVLRTSMGATLAIPWRRSDDVAADLDALRRDFACELVATVLDPTAEPLAGASLSRRRAILFGSEGHGLPADLVAICDRRLTIPMPPTTDSLNVVVAAGIFLHALGAGGR